MSISTERVINASAERVYDILTDFGRYSNWNPSLIRVEAKEGSELTATADAILNFTCRWEDGKEELLPQKIVTLERPNKFVMMNLNHSHLIEPIKTCVITTNPNGEGVLFTVLVVMPGFVGKMAIKLYGAAIQNQINIEADALKVTAESKSAV